MVDGKSIKNVNVLDLRNATEASIGEISSLGNANVVVYTPETAPLLQKLTIENANAMVEVDTGVKVEGITGQITISGDFFEGYDSPVFLLVIGQAIVEPDVSIEKIDEALHGIVVIGQLLCPKPLMGAFQSKAVQIIGKTSAYPVLTRIVKGGMVLDVSRLESFEDGTEITVLGSVKIVEPVPNELLKRKLGKLFALSGVRCYEENATALQAQLVDGSGRLTIIPTGYKVVEKPLWLDQLLLESLSSSKLYCTENVFVDSAVDAATLDKHLEALVCRGTVVSPTTLSGVVTQKCDPLENELLFYEGELWRIEDDETLTAARFDHLESTATLYVSGDLDLDPGLSPDLITKRLSKIHNRGTIRCTSDQMGAVQAKLGLQDGSVVDADADEPEYWLVNANYLAL